MNSRRHEPALNELNEVVTILLLEDDDDLREDLVHLISQSLPSVEVKSFADQYAAACSLETADRNSSLLGLLDIQVPKAPGKNPEVCEDIAELLRKKRIPIVFMTSFTTSPDVVQFLETHRLTDAQLVVVPKSNLDDFVDRLLEEIRGWVARIRSQAVAESLRRLLHDCSCDCSSGELLRLQDYIRRHWWLLDQDSRDQVHEYFVVSEPGDGCIDNLVLR